MTAYIYVQNNDNNHRVACEDTVTIGRGKNNNIVIENSQVSRNHAIIRRVGKVVYHLIDCDSANGTFLDEHRIDKPTLLRNGSKISIGTAKMTFSQGNAEYINESDLETQDDTLTATLVKPG
jgi:pSer/pThr/pTyr-binding forkhead associated (FHA) protein